MHIVPNGEIKVVSNKTRGWSRAVVDVGVPYGENVDRALEVAARRGRPVLHRQGLGLPARRRRRGAGRGGPERQRGGAPDDARGPSRARSGLSPASSAAGIKNRFDREKPRDSVPAAPSARPRRRRPAARSRRPRRGRGRRRMSLRLYNTLTRRVEPFAPLQPRAGVALHLRPHGLQLRPHREFPDLPVRGPAAAMARGERLRGVPHHEPHRRGRPDHRRGVARGRRRCASTSQPFVARVLRGPRLPPDQPAHRAIRGRPSTSGR